MKRPPCLFAPLSRAKVAVHTEEPLGATFSGLLLPSAALITAFSGAPASEPFRFLPFGRAILEPLKKPCQRGSGPLGGLRLL